MYSPKKTEAHELLEELFYDKFNKLNLSILIDPVILESMLILKDQKLYFYVVYTRPQRNRIF